MVQHLACIEHYEFILNPPSRRMQDLGTAGLKAYYGANLQRLSAIKTTYDPSAFFSYPNSIPAVTQA